MIKTIYVYLILFATLMMAIGGSVSVFMAIADYVSPQPYYQSFEDYKQMRLSYKGAEDQPNKEVVIDEDKLKDDYDEMILNELENEKKRGLNRLIKSFGWIVIPLPVFLYYQRRLKTL